MRPRPGIISMLLVLAVVGCGGLQRGPTFRIQPPVANYVEDLDDRELKEQVRDWAVVGTLAKLGATAEQAAAATYEVPLARLPYLDELYAFEYGRGRRVYFEGRLLLFRDADDPDPHATLGRLADRVRMESGELPATAEVYLVHDERDAGMIEIERAPDLSRRTLMSSAYGYVEGTITDEASLAAWMARADDLTYARIAEDGTLVVGGRRFRRSRTANLAAEDVAAIYQAHERLEERKRAARRKIDALPDSVREAFDAYERHLEAGTPTTPAGEDAAFMFGLMTLTLPEDEIAATRAAISDYLADRSPGFSLDPVWVPDPDDPSQPLLARHLQDLADDPCAAMRDIAATGDALGMAEPDESRRTARATWAIEFRDQWRAAGRSAALCDEIRAHYAGPLRSIAHAAVRTPPETWERGLVGFHELMNSLVEDPDVGGPSRAALALLWGALRFYEEDARVQCARYEGTEHTGVGMTLFYTDLLAKMWQSTDYGSSAPFDAVPGFLSSPGIDLPWTFSSGPGSTATRIWFGARLDGSSKTAVDGGLALLFAPRLTRIYAASTNLARPGVEGQPGEAERRSLSWWDHHFDEVADYEPEFHRQDQIMKWSLITAALREREQGAWLGEVEVPSVASFASWQRDRGARLRFAEALRPTHVPMAGRECIPILSSRPFSSMGSLRLISGGVTAPGSSTLGSLPTIDPAAKLGTRRVDTISVGARRTGTSIRPVPLRTKQTIEFTNAAEAQTVDLHGPIPVGTARIEYGARAKPGDFTIEAFGDGTTIARLEVAADPRKVTLTWSEGDLERARQMAAGRTQWPESDAATLAAADALARAGDAAGATAIYERLLPPKASTVEDLVRSAVRAGAYRHPVELAALLHGLARLGEPIAENRRELLAASLARAATPQVARHVDESLAAGKPLRRDSFDVKVHRGEVVLTRDVVTLETDPLPAHTDLSGRVVYRPDRVRAGEEGHQIDTGATLARARRHRHVRIEELVADPIGDRVQVKDRGVTLVREEQPPSSTQLSSPPRTLRPVIVTPCDDDGATETTTDDCDR